MPPVPERRLLSRDRTIDFLGKLDARKEDTAMSIYFPSGVSAGEIGVAVAKIISPDIAAGLAELVASSRNGAGIFWGTEFRCAVMPPFPIGQQSGPLPGYEVRPLLQLLEKDFRVAIILVRLGTYAMGLYQGESLINSKVGTGLVHGRHRQGGSSQKRFYRHREKQIESFLTRVCRHAREQLEPLARSIDYMVYGGARTTILLLQKQCPFLQQFNDRVVAQLLDVPEPDRGALEAAIRRAWSSSVFTWLPI